MIYSPDFDSFSILPRTGTSPYLVDSLGRRHGSLDCKTSDVLPPLLEQRHKVVDSQHDVCDQLVLGHLDVADGDTETQDLLELELDGALDFGDLVVEVFSVGDGSRELAGLGQTRTKETGDLLDESVGGNEGIVLAGELFDEFLVLVELLEIVGRHGVNAEMFGPINVVLVTENAGRRGRLVFFAFSQVAPAGG